MSKSADRQLKNELAKKRQAERDERSPKEQLEKLDAKLGAGIGAKKERARLEKLIAEADSKKTNTQKGKIVDD
jgi:cell shape-determining protein MreC